MQHMQSNGEAQTAPQEICIGFVIATLTECLFLPFEVFPAFAYWFAFGDLFVKKVPKNKFLQELEDEA